MKISFKPKKKNIVQIEPWINYQEAFQLLRVIKSKYITEQNLTNEFETLIKQLTKSKYAISISNGTLALYVTLKTLGIGPGDEVIVPDLTFIATSNAVLMTGAKPILCDISLEDWGLDTERIEALITNKTKAIMPVHLYGGSANILTLKEISNRNKIHLIEDAAQCIGAYSHGKHLGTFGIAGIFSFYGNKTVTCGEGGLILTDSDEIAQKIYKFKNYGRSTKGTFIHESIGFNFKFTEMQAAIGIAQMHKLNKTVEKKDKIHNWYKAELNTDTIFMPLRKNIKPVYWFNSIKVKNIEELQNYLNLEGVQTRRIFYPLHLQPCYKGILNNEDNFNNTKYIYDNYLSLPSSFSLKKNDVKYISSKIKEFYNS